MDKIIFGTEKFGIYDREAAYSSHKHWGSFIFWEMVDITSTFISSIFVIVFWELFLRNLFF